MQINYRVQKANGRTFLRLDSAESQGQNAIAAIHVNGKAHAVVDLLAFYDYSGQLSHGAIVGLQHGLRGTVYEDDGTKKFIIKAQTAYWCVSEGAVADLLEQFSKQAAQEVGCVLGKHAKPSAVFSELFAAENLSMML